MSPFAHTTGSAVPRWSARDLAGVLTAGDVRLVEIDRSTCDLLEPLACVLEPNQLGIVFGVPRVAADTARVVIKVVGRESEAGMLSLSYTEHTLVRRTGRWVPLSRRWLGGT